MLNRYIKCDILSHLNNRKLYQTLKLIDNNKNEYEKILQITGLKRIIFKDYSDIKYPLDIFIWFTNNIINPNNNKISRTRYSTEFLLHNINELLEFLSYLSNNTNNTDYIKKNYTIYKMLDDISKSASYRSYYMNINNKIHMSNLLQKELNIKKKIDIINNFDILNNTIFMCCYIMIAYNSKHLSNFVYVKSRNKYLLSHT